MLATARALHACQRIDFDIPRDVPSGTVCKAFLCAVVVPRQMLTEVDDGILGTHVAGALTSVCNESKLAHYAFDTSAQLCKRQKWPSEVWQTIAEAIGTPCDIDPRNFVDGAKIMKRSNDVSCFVNFHRMLQKEHGDLYQQCSGASRDYPLLLWLVQCAQKERIDEIVAALFPNEHVDDQAVMAQNVAQFYSANKNNAFHKQYALIMREMGIDAAVLPPLDFAVWTSLIEDERRNTYGPPAQKTESAPVEIITNPLVLAHDTMHPVDNMLDAFASSIGASILTAAPRVEMLYLVAGLTNAREAYDALFMQRNDTTRAKFASYITANDINGVVLHQAPMWGHFLTRCINAERRTLKSSKDLHESSLALNVNSFYKHIALGDGPDIATMPLPVNCATFETRVQMWLSHHSTGMAQTFGALFNIRLSTQAQKGLKQYRKNVKHADVDALRDLHAFYFVKK